MEAAYEGLSDTFRAMIDGLAAVHDFKNFRVLYQEYGRGPGEAAADGGVVPQSVAPGGAYASGDRPEGIYVNPQFTLRIEGLERDESRALLDVLFAQAHVPEYQFRLRWEPNTIVFWDNRSTQHYAANDYYPQRRRMERTAVVGDMPV